MREVHVEVGELAKNMDVYIRHVRSGNVVVITEAGVPVGKIVPAGKEGKDLSRILTLLSQIGAIEWDGQSFRPPKPKVVNKGDKLASEIVSEDRDVKFVS